MPFSARADEQNLRVLKVVTILSPSYLTAIAFRGKGGVETNQAPLLLRECEKCRPAVVSCPSWVKRYRSFVAMPYPKSA